MHTHPHARDSRHQPNTPAGTHTHTHTHTIPTSDGRSKVDAGGAACRLLHLAPAARARLLHLCRCCRHAAARAAASATAAPPHLRGGDCDRPGTATAATRCWRPGAVRRGRRVRCVWQRGVAGSTGIERRTWPWVCVAGGVVLVWGGGTADLGRIITGAKKATSPAAHNSGTSTPPPHTRARLHHHTPRLHGTRPAVTMDMDQGQQQQIQQARCVPCVPCCAASVRCVCVCVCMCIAITGVLCARRVCTAQSWWRACGVACGADVPPCGAVEAIVSVWCCRCGVVLWLPVGVVVWLWVVRRATLCVEGCVCVCVGGGVRASVGVPHDEHKPDSEDGRLLPCQRLRALG